MLSVIHGCPPQRRPRAVESPARRGVAIIGNERALFPGLSGRRPDKHWIKEVASRELRWQPRSVSRRGEGESLGMRRIRLQCSGVRRWAGVRSAWSTAARVLSRETVAQSPSQGIVVSRLSPVYARAYSCPLPFIPQRNTRCDGVPEA